MEHCTQMRGGLTFDCSGENGGTWGDGAKKEWWLGCYCFQTRCDCGLKEGVMAIGLEESGWLRETHQRWSQHGSPLC